MDKTGMGKIRQNAKKKKRARLLLFVTVSVVVAVIFSVVFNIVFSIENLTVINNTEYSEEELLSHSGISKGMPLLFVRESSVSEKVSLSLPYVESAFVEKSWPRSVTVTFNAAKPKYLLKTSDGTEITVSEGLKVLGTSENFSDGIIPVEGIAVDKYETGRKISEAENIEISLLSEITEGLKSVGLYQRVTAIDFRKKHNYTLVLDGTITVQLGTSENLDKKFEKLTDILLRNSNYTKMDISVRDYKAGRVTVTE